MDEKQLLPTGFSKTVLALVSNMPAAVKITKAAKNCGLGVHNGNKAETLLKHMKESAPALVLIDWDGCEAEGYKLLSEMRGREELKRVPVFGYVSQSKEAVKQEAQRAGCDRVYSKTEFMNDLEIILARGAL